MPEFVYQGLDAQGAVRQGRLHAATPSDALRQLRGQGITATDLRPAEGTVADAPGVAPQQPPSRRTWRRRRVSRKDMATFTSELATMLRAGLTLERSLRLLHDINAAQPELQKAVTAILDDIKAGQPLSRALARHPALFDDFFVSLVRAGESTGHLAQALDRIVEHQTRVRELRDKAMAAATYPAILAGVSLLSLVVMLVYVVPQFRSVFGELGERLPLPTRWVMSLSDALTAQPAYAASAVAMLLVAVVWVASRPKARAAALALLYRWPIVGALMLRYRQAMFARTLGALLANGVNLVAALRIAADTMQQPAHRDVVAQAAQDVKAGRRVAEALGARGFFEPLIINLVKVGEETGRLGPMWTEAAAILERDVQQRLQRLLALLEPVLILTLGAIIAAIIMAILMGILAVNDLAAL